MQDARSWVATWQSLAPLLTGVVVIMMMKWVSHHWAAAALERTVRVASKLRGRHSSSTGSRAFRR
jgi:hypothetical protein